MENVVRDVRAAMLCDGGGLKHRQIGIVLDVSLPPDSKRSGGHATVSQMVRRGRKILERAFGEEGWREKAQAMKVEAEGLVEEGKEVCATRTAWVLDVPVEEVRPHVRLNPRTGLPELDDEYEAKFNDGVVEYVENVSSRHREEVRRRAERRVDRHGTPE